MSDTASNRSGSESEQKTEAQISKEIEEKCWEAFLEYDPEGSGQICSDDFGKVINMMQVRISEAEMFKIISELDPENEGTIQYSDFKTKILQREIARLKGSDETELLDAFVAMGGEADGEGCVDAKKLIKTIKEEFEMTIDIEKLIEEIDEDGSGEIEFDEFKALLQGDDA